MSIVEKYLDCIKKCEREMSPDGSPCIYRGEPGRYPKVSSTLYRYYEEMAGPGWEEELEWHERSEILKKNDSLAGQELGEHFAKIQHLGGRTNWIDFTKCPLVALFFACFGEHGIGDNVGRIIVARESFFDKDNIVEPKCDRYINPKQRSVLVRSNGGVIGVDRVNVRQITVPLCPPPRGKERNEVWEEKDGILTELREKDVHLESIYPDTFGYIRFQRFYLAPFNFLTRSEGQKEHLEGRKGNHRSGYQWGFYLDPDRLYEINHNQWDRYKVVHQKTGHIFVEGSASECMEFLEPRQKP